MPSVDDPFSITASLPGQIAALMLMGSSTGSG